MKSGLRGVVFNDTILWLALPIASQVITDLASGTLFYRIAARGVVTCWNLAAHSGWLSRKTNGQCLPVLR